MIIKDEFIVKNPQGLHARPAAILCRLTSQFDADIQLSKDGVNVNGKSVMGVMMLAAEHGSSVRVEISGSDAEVVWEQLKNLADNNFDE
jgi:phosphocarrier protein